MALLGPNGAGKSTLLLQLNGLLRGEGAIEVRGRLLEDSSLAAIRAQVGLLFSNPDDQLFSPTVLDDIAYGPLHQGLVENEVLRRAQAALAEVGMSGYEARTPHRLSLARRSGSRSPPCSRCGPPSSRSTSPPPRSRRAPARS